jgi:hypothetical protein
MPPSSSAPHTSPRSGSTSAADGQQYLRVGGQWYKATGDGQRRELNRLYGPGRLVPQHHIGPITGEVIALFRSMAGGQNMEVFNPPRAAEGLVVTAGPTLAMLGEKPRALPEIVTPVRMMAATFRDVLAERQETIVLNARLYLGTKDITDLVRVEVDRQDREGVRMLVAGVA